MARSSSGHRFRSPLPDRIQRLLERGLPATILILVAFVQIYLAHTAHLSPWKGGGFGMFGAIDSPDMRVIQAEALDRTGQLIQLDVESGLDEYTLRRIRTLPRQRDLEQLAPQLVSQAVVPTTVQRQAVYEKLRASKADLSTLQVPQDGGTLSSHPMTQPLYRLKTIYDPDVPEATKTLKAVRLQWWRLRFDPDQHRVWAEPLSSTVTAGGWP